MNIRLMIDADLPVVSQIDDLSFSQPWPPAAFELELANSNARCWVTEMEEKQSAVGETRVVAALVLWRVLDEAHIATIAVHPNFRQLGIGKLLLQTSMQAAFAEGARIYHLEVRAGNLVAQKMYTQFGYAIVGRRPGYYKDTGEDALLMTLDLTQTNPG
ncbi:MAG: ribosomal protein S18-alanine N-acetyltransferase [Chloroflexi bacterium]|nr:ribosomal protein S18-alanine N-acetyltransferase [Chloroflexota bacterium]